MGCGPGHQHYSGSQGASLADSALAADVLLSSGRCSLRQSQYIGLLFLQATVYLPLVNQFLWGSLLQCTVSQQGDFFAYLLLLVL